MLNANECPFSRTKTHQGERDEAYIEGGVAMIYVEESKPALPRADQLVVRCIGVGLIGQNFRLIREHDGSDVGHSGTNVEHPSFLVGVECNLTGDIRPRTNEADIPTQHVDELGNLIQLPSTDYAAEASDSGVSCSGRHHAGAVGTYDHGSQLYHAEWDIISPDTLSYVEGGFEVLKVDERGKHEKEGAEDRQADPGKNDVYRPLHANR